MCLPRLAEKTTVEAALGGELSEHLGHTNNCPKSGQHTRNGYSRKIIITDDGQFEREVPRDRDSSFELQLIKKHQKRLMQMDDQVLFFYT